MIVNRIAARSVVFRRDTGTEALAAGPTTIRCEGPIARVPQANAKAFATPRQAVLDCPYRAAEHAGGFFVGDTFQVTEHGRGAEPLGKPPELLVDQVPQFDAVAWPRIANDGTRRSRGGPFSSSPADVGRSAKRHTR